jgi:proline iminopeptidase
VAPTACSRKADSSAFASIECHYFVNAGFFPEGHLIKKEQLDKM